MKEQELRDLVDYLVAFPNEKEWVEFKVNNSKPEVIGERLSAIANSACLQDEPYGYVTCTGIKKTVVHRHYSLFDYTISSFTASSSTRM